MAGFRSRSLLNQGKVTNFQKTGNRNVEAQFLFMVCHRAFEPMRNQFNFRTR